MKHLISAMLFLFIALNTLAQVEATDFNIYIITPEIETDLLQPVGNAMEVLLPQPVVSIRLNISGAEEISTLDIMLGKAKNKSNILGDEVTFSTQDGTITCTSTNGTARLIDGNRLEIDYVLPEGTDIDSNWCTMGFNLADGTQGTTLYKKIEK